MKAKPFGRNGFHIEIDGIVFKSSGYCGGASVNAMEAYDDKRRMIVKSLVETINELDQEGMIIMHERDLDGG